MPKQINYTLTESELRELEQAIAHDPRPEVVRRATAIRLLHHGHKPPGVAEMVSASRASVHQWHKSWREGGLEALVNKPIPGRKPKADQTYQAALASTLDSDPHELGYAFSVWTLERLSQHLEQVTGIPLSAARLAEWMSRWGYVYRRPKLDLTHKQDASQREQVQAWLDELKKQPRQAIVGSSLWTKPPSALSSP
jgi:transposase